MYTSPESMTPFSRTNLRSAKCNWLSQLHHRILIYRSTWAKIEEEAPERQCLWKKTLITYTSWEWGTHHTTQGHPGMYQETGDRRKNKGKSLAHSKAEQASSSGLAGLNHSSTPAAEGLSPVVWSLALGWFKAGGILAWWVNYTRRRFQVWALDHRGEEDDPVH